MDELMAQHAHQHQQVIDRLNELQAGVNALNVVVNALNVTVGALQENQQLASMQSINAASSLNAPIRYPPGVDIIVPQFPVIKIELITLNAANAQFVSQGLGLPLLAPNTPVAIRRQQIIDFLGCAISVT
ncbi:hypothetical protein H4582DRAFT_2054848 [Lactarius indigo]|nr:hypothetical protein H4582DRAFT_2054848 [Lactarius indigo]